MIRWGRLSGIGVLASLAIAGSIFAHAGTFAAQDVASAENRTSPALDDPSISDTDRARALVSRALARESEGRSDAALDDFGAALSLHALAGDDLARVLFDRGVAFDALGHLDRAIKDYSAAIRLSPQFAAALNNRANAYRRTGRPALARRDYLASLAAGNANPEFSDFGLGQVAEAQGRRDEARDFYGRALAANPDYALAAERLSALSSENAAGPAANAPIVLKPPRQPGQAIVLKPPPAHERPTIAPASYEPADGDLDLRPSMDSGEQPPARAAPGTLVQLGAWRDEASAAEGWNRAREHSGGALSGLTPHIVAVDLPGKGLYFRLRAGPVSGDASNFCSGLRSHGLACLVVRGG